MRPENIGPVYDFWLTPYARQICNTIIQIPEIQKFISICIDAAPIGHMKCHNNFDIVQSCWP